MKRNDNRGASFVMVVVAMAIVAVLAVTVLWIALMNLQGLLSRIYKGYGELL